MGCEQNQGRDWFRASFDTEVAVYVKSALELHGCARCVVSTTEVDCCPVNQMFLRK